MLNNIKLWSETTWFHFFLINLLNHLISEFWSFFNYVFQDQQTFPATIVSYWAIGLGNLRMLTEEKWIDGFSMAIWPIGHPIIGRYVSIKRWRKNTFGSFEQFEYWEILLHHDILLRSNNRESNEIMKKSSFQALLERVYSPRILKGLHYRLLCTRVLVSLSLSFLHFSFLSFSPIFRVETFHEHNRRITHDTGIKLKAFVLESQCTLQISHHAHVIGHLSPPPQINTTGHNRSI